MPHKDTARRRAYSQEYKRRNRERIAALNADGDRKRHANRRAAKYEAPGVLTLEDVRYVLRDRRCFYCGIENPPWLGIDHVIPLHDSGPNTRSNIVACCHSCNASKWRGDRPGRWSRNYDSCQRCGTTEREHKVHGLCSLCWWRDYAPKYAEQRAGRMAGREDKPCKNGHPPTPENVCRRKDRGDIAYCRVCRHEKRAAQRALGETVSD